MAVVANRTVSIVYSGDVVGTQALEAPENATASGAMEVKSLISGNNTITVPTGGTMVSAVTIVPPVGNTVILTLKGVNGDTGIPLHLTGPSSLALPSTATSFVINASDVLTGLRLYWS